MPKESGNIIFTKPVVADAVEIHRLIANAPPLDLNSLYCYLILCTHFAETSVVARSPEGICGYISAYLIPERPDTLFVWQVVVSPNRHGQGIARSMLLDLMGRPYSTPPHFLETTVNPSNGASDALFISIARSCNTICDKRVLFSKSAFGNQTHEDEILYRIGPFDSQ